MPAASHGRKGRSSLRRSLRGATDPRSHPGATDAGRFPPLHAGRGPLPLGVLGALLVAASLGMTQAASAVSIVGSAHDLGTSAAPWLCEFCHTPNYTGAVTVPVWSRASNGLEFPVYGAPTVGELPPDLGGLPPSWPGVATRLCLSCHDGLNASGVLYGNGDSLAVRHHMVRRIGVLPEDVPRFRPRGTSLIAGHPVFVRYLTQSFGADFHLPPLRASAGPGSDVKLVDGVVECVSCHDAHDPTFKPFLRRSNAGSAMCMTCHMK